MTNRESWRERDARIRRESREHYGAQVAAEIRKMMERRNKERADSKANEAAYYDGLKLKRQFPAW